MAKKSSTSVKFLSSASPKFKFDEEEFQVKPGFNEMPEVFTSDPYYKMCVDDKIIQDFVSVPTDRQHENFDKQIKAERERADALQKELEELKAVASASVQTDSVESK